MNIDESIIEQRKQRRRERNRLAAQRCRLKKREQTISVSQVCFYHMSVQFRSLNFNLKKFKLDNWYSVEFSETGKMCERND